MQRQITKLSNKIEKGIEIQDFCLDFLFGSLIFAIIFGIGFTFGYLSR